MMKSENATPEEKASSRSQRRNALKGRFLEKMESTWLPAMLGGLLYWLALPPVNWGFLAWISPVPWLLLVRRETLRGKHPYLVVWCFGALFWLGNLYWMTMPFWATSIGWILSGAYLGLYPVFLIGLSRLAVHRFRLPLMFVFPTIWIAMDLLRKHVLGGMSFGGIEHAQVEWTMLIQIADLFGEYGVAWVIVFCASGLAAAIPYRGQPARWRLLGPAVGVLIVVLGYGYARMNLSNVEGNLKTPPLRVALTQGNFGVYMFPEDPHWYSKTQQQYIELSRRAIDEAGPLDLIVWPETVCIHRLLRYRDDFSLSPETRWEGTDAELGQMMNLQRRKFEVPLKELGEELDRTPLLLGISIVRLGPQEEPFRYNSAVLLGHEGKIEGIYDKIHLVIFGEYVPFSEYLPDWVPIESLCLDTARGEHVVSLEVGPYRLAPNICFESSVPHYIRHQVAVLKEKGREPDFLVNLTNAGWFWFTNEMDQHLAANIFRAVECRKPHLVAANCGYSCWIDGSGRVVKRGKRKEATYVVADVVPDPRKSFYVIWGDVLPISALIFAGFLFIAGAGGVLRNRKKEPSGSSR